VFTRILRTGRGGTGSGILYRFPIRDVENMHELRRGGNNKALFLQKKHIYLIKY